VHLSFKFIQIFVEVQISFMTANELLRSMFLES